MEAPLSTSSLETEALLSGLRALRPSSFFPAGLVAGPVSRLVVAAEAAAGEVLMYLVR